MSKSIILKQGKEATCGLGHPWIFSGAIEKKDDNIEHGEVVLVKACDGVVIGMGAYSGKSMIAVRIFDFKETEIDEEWFVAKLKSAEAHREFLGYGPESDMENLKENLVAAIKKVFNPKTIIERSDMSSRQAEGLPEAKSVLFGDEVAEVEFLENGYKFTADLMNGQKTGFFLDQKDLRLEIAKFADKKTIMNLFSYTGATSVYAIKSGAKKIINLDGSEEALAGVDKNAKLNKIPKTRYEKLHADIFQYLSEKNVPEFDMVILDPPALIKARNGIESGIKAYHFINRAAMRLVKDGGIFVTSSCSHFLSVDDFVKTLKRASRQIGVNLKLIKRVSQSADHPMSIYFPEGGYLKSFIFKVENESKAKL
ncbi:MAG: Ribosomal RNA large subunit methyltransferase I [Candidatus Peregrinibacteria bacterium GW2011_GWA2_43_8]|nr:MAG: Ribosomal RNA large subunit methyltransferase I [Candidatus Peregrinibacteria bacterium GW2011_GWA2_43_8]